MSKAEFLFYGSITSSITWITPLVARISVSIITASSEPNSSAASVSVMVKLPRFSVKSPPKVVIVLLDKLGKSVEKTLASTTWYLSTASIVEIPTALTRAVKSATSANSYNDAKAASVGANTVYGPSPFNTVIRSAAVSSSSTAVKAATNCPNSAPSEASEAATAMSTISSDAGTNVLSIK